MERTPTFSRKANLSLGRLKPQCRTIATNSHGELLNNNASVPTPRSPSVLSISADDVGIECTPPHKKRNLDDSVDYSPKVFDSSFSPSGLFSQTMAMDSPEVGWRWGQRAGTRSLRADCDNSSTTPDSAYAADSSFTSASSTEMAANVCTLRPRHSYDHRREEQRKALELQLRRAEKARADEMLKQRCAKFQEQLNDVITQKKQNKENDTLLQPHEEPTVFSQEDKRTTCSSTLQATSSSPTPNTEHFLGNDTLDDFLNDSDSDCLLLEATQQLESKIVELTQKPTTSPVQTSQTIPRQNDSDTATASSSKEKRSSLYMKFLEDDVTDDWFLSLDDVILQATQTKKPRTSLQRYKSMPANSTRATATTTATTLRTKTAGSAGTNAKTMTATVTPIVTRSMNISNEFHESITDAAAGSPNGSLTAKMRRHASTHSLSPASASYRGRQLRLRK